MNTPSPSFKFWTKFLTATLGLCAATMALHAQTYAWNVNANGYWTEATNWNPATGYPDGAGVVADLSQLNISSSLTVTLNGSATVASVLIGDTNNTSAYTLTYSNGSILTFDSGSTDASILKATAGASNTKFYLNVSLLSDLIVSNENLGATTSGYFDLGANGGGQIISAGSAGLKTITFSGDSTKRINVYSSIQDGDGQIGVYAGVYNVITYVNTSGDTVTSAQALSFYSENTFTGGLTISGRVITQNTTSNVATAIGDAALGGQGCAITFNGGSINFSGTTSAGTDNIIDRNITLLSTGGSLEPNSGHTLTVTGVIDGAGALTKSAAGTIILTGVNTYEGGTVINAGTLSIGADSNLGAANTSVTMNGGTLSFLAGINESASKRGLIINGTSTLSLGSSAFINWYGSLSGAGLLVKAGGSTFSLNNTNSNHTGGILVTGGTIRFRGGDGAMGAAGNGLSLSNGTYLNASEDLTMGKSSEGVLRTITLLSGIVGININAAKTLTWEGAIVGTGGLNKTNDGTLVLLGGATYTGNTTVTGGILRMGADQRISSVSGLILNGGTFDLGGHSQTMATLRVLADSTIIVGDGGLNTLVFGDSSAVVWTTGTVLSITGDAVSGQTIRVGTSASGLTADQLAQIFVNGNAVSIDASGYLTFIPEPAAAAQLLGLSALLLISLRRRSLKH